MQGIANRGSWLRAIAAHAAASETRKDRNVRRIRLRRWTRVLLAVFVFATRAEVGNGSYAQEAASDPARAKSPARYLPRDIGLMFIEFDGLDAHPEAWSKAAASKLLNDTTLGEMLESVGVQMIDQLAPKNEGARVENAEIMQILRHMLHRGFCYSSAASLHGNVAKTLDVLVLRDAARKDARSMFSRGILSMPVTSAAKLTKVETRQVVVMTYGPETAKTTINWWVEGDDVVICDQELAASVMGAIDGKVPNMTANPRWSRLESASGTAVPLGCAWIDAESLSKRIEAPGAAGGKSNPLAALSAVETSWSLRDEAIEQTTRIEFKKGTLESIAGATKLSADGTLPFPKDAPAYTEFSVRFDAMLDAALTGLDKARAASAKADDGESPRARLDAAAESLMKRYKIDLRKDFLAQLGPRAGWYIAPAGTLKAAAAATKKGAAKAKSKDDEPDSKAAAEEAEKGPLEGIAGLLPGLGASHPATKVPDFGFIVEIKNATAFNRGLDAVAALLNSTIREQKRAAAAAAKKKDAAASPGGLAGGGRPNLGGRGGAAAAGAEGETPAPKELADFMSELKPLPGKEKAFIFMLTLPNVPGTTRLFLRVGPKYLVLSNSGELSHEIASQSEGLNPSARLSAAVVDQLKRDALMLDFADQANDAAETLARLPAAIQTSYNQAKLLIAAGAAKRTEVAAGVPSGVFQPGAAGGGFGGGAGAGAGPAGPGGESGGLVLQFDAARLPKADALRALFFPSTTVIAANEAGVTITARSALPFMSMFTPTMLTANASTAALALPAIQAARDAARKAAGGATPNSAAPASPGVPGVPQAPLVGGGNRGRGAAPAPNSTPAPPAAKGAAAGAVPGDQ